MKLLAVDSNSILNRAYYGIKLLTTKNGQFTNGIYGFLNILFKVLDETHPDHVAFAFDVKAPTFRHQMFDGYKAQRKGMPDELAAQLEPLKELLRLMGYQIIETPGFEADDILGTLSQSCREAGWECVIATGDRDSFQLVGDGVTVRLASTKMGRSEAEMIDSSVIGERYGVTPRQMIEVKALMGDSSDNIPGVAGIGEKTALELIKDFSTLDGVYENIDSPLIKKGAREKLLKGKEMAYKSRELAEINCKVPLPVTLDALAPTPLQNDRLYRLLDSLELRTVITRLKLTLPTSTEDVAVDAELEEPEPPVTFSQNNSERFLAALSANEVYLSLRYRDQRPVMAAVLSDELSLIDEQCAEFEALLPKILEQSQKLSLPDSKQFYRFGYELSKNIQIVAFDPILAGYLLNPLSASYSVESLSAGQNVRRRAAELPEGLGETQKALVEEVLLLPSLCHKERELIEQNGQGKLLFEIEQPLSRVLASMEYLGFSVDAGGIEAFGKELDGDLEELTKRIYFYAQCEFNLNSPKQLGEVLFEKLGLPAKKKTKSGYSTDVDVLESLRAKHPIIEDILSYRKLSKLKSTYVEGLLKVVAPDKRVHTSFRQTETRTGRISSTEPNLQNIPIRTELGSSLRRFFVAEEGKTLVDADYSQIELRVLAHIADDKAMQQSFLEGVDIHTRTASQVFDLPEDFVTPTMRSRAKAVNFGIVYGIGAFSLSQNIGVTVSEADQYIKNYLATYSGVKRYMEETIAFGKENGYVETIFGRRRQLPELKASNHNMRAFGERVAMNTPIQGSSADIIKLAMIRVFERLKREGMRSRLILQVHDELIVESPMDEAEAAAKIVVEEMERAVSLKVPLVADVGTAKNWLDAK